MRKNLLKTKLKWHKLFLENVEKNTDFKSLNLLMKKQRSDFWLNCPSVVNDLFEHLEFDEEKMEKKPTIYLGYRLENC